MSDTVAGVGNANAPRLAGAAQWGAVGAKLAAAAAVGVAVGFGVETLFSRIPEHAVKVGGQVEAVTGNSVWY